MRNDAADFPWLFPPDGDGYVLTEWKRPRWGPLKKGLPAIAPREDAGWSSYRPLADETGLFRILAETPATPEGCLAFANRYGSLGGVTRLYSAYVHLLPAAAMDKDPLALELNSWLNPKGLGWLGEGEPLAIWLACIGWLAELVPLWDLIRARDESALAARVRRVEKGVRVRGPEGARRSSTS